MTTHRARRTVRSAALAAVTAALALGLTACGADDDSKEASGDRTAVTDRDRSASDADRADSSGDATKEAPAATTSGGTSTKGKSTGDAATGDAQPCRGDEMLVTAAHRFAGQQGDHLLVTAVNEGTEPCWVTSYPAVVPDGDVDIPALPHSDKDNPGGDRHITLRPGAMAYSAVNLFDNGSENHTAQSLAIALRGADGHDGPFYSVVVKGQNSRFSWNEADVLNWSTEKPYDF